MCNVIGRLLPLALSRRELLRGTTTIVGATAATLLAGVPKETIAAGISDPSALRALRGHAQAANTRLVLLGTAGGPVWWHGSTREGIASAVVVNDAVYLIDCGDGVGRQFRHAGLGGQRVGEGLEHLRAIFLTHLHSDHTIDYPNLLVMGQPNGLRGATRPIEVYGPGDRGALPLVFGQRADLPAVINEPSPTPGIVEMTDYLWQAFATDLNDRIRDSGARDPRTLFQPHDVVLPPGLGDHANDAAPPRTAPFPVYEDEHVRVSATLVDHGAMFPSLAYRFDTPDGAIVISGDTAPCENLVELAQGADVLVHEVQDSGWIESLVGPSPRPAAREALFQHLVQSHTAIEDVGQVAEAARTKTLVLTHLSPANNATHRWLGAQANFSGRLIVGEDLMQVGVG